MVRRIFVCKSCCNGKFVQLFVNAGAIFPKHQWQQNGIGKSMAVACMRALQAEHINKVNIIAFKSNELGKHFWQEEGWTFRDDLNYYDFTLNETNITNFNK